MLIPTIPILEDRYIQNDKEEFSTYIGLNGELTISNNTIKIPDNIHPTLTYKDPKEINTITQIIVFINALHTMKIKIHNKNNQYITLYKIIQPNDTKKPESNYIGLKLTTIITNDNETFYTFTPIKQLIEEIKNNQLL